MKRAVFALGFREPISKRKFYEFLPERIQQDPEREAQIWKEALTHLWEMDDPTDWSWYHYNASRERDLTCAIFKPTRPRKKLSNIPGQQSFALANADRVFAFVNPYTSVLCPPAGGTQEIEAGADEIYGQLDTALWIAGLEAFVGLVPYQDWYVLIYVSKATAQFFHGPNSPFIHAWATVRKLLPAVTWQEHGCPPQRGKRVDKYRPWAQLRRFLCPKMAKRAIFHSPEITQEVVRRFVVGTGQNLPIAFGLQLRGWEIFYDEQLHTWKALENITFGIKAGPFVAGLTPAGFRVATPPHKLRYAKVIFPLECFYRYVPEVVDAIIQRKLKLK